MLCVCVWWGVGGRGRGAEGRTASHVRLVKEKTCRNQAEEKGHKMMNVCAVKGGGRAWRLAGKEEGEGIILITQPQPTTCLFESQRQRHPLPPPPRSFLQSGAQPQGLACPPSTTQRHDFALATHACTRKPPPPLLPLSALHTHQPHPHATRRTHLPDDEEEEEEEQHTRGTGRRVVS